MERRSTHFRGRGLVRTTWQPITQAQWLGSYWLKRADRRISTSFAVDLKAWGIIASEWAALREMYRPGRNSSLGLATAIGMTKGGASKLVDRLAIILLRLAPPPPLPRPLQSPAMLPTPRTIAREICRATNDDPTQGIPSGCAAPG